MVEFNNHTISSRPKSFISVSGYEGQNSNIIGINENFLNYKIPFSKYQIKETDMRVKTCTFSSTEYADLSKKKRIVTIVSDSHENFTGIILSCEYDEETGLYNYSAQDMRRQYITKYHLVLNGTAELYNVIKSLLTLSFNSEDFSDYSSFTLSPEREELYKGTLARLSAKDNYLQTEIPNVPNFNPMLEKPKAIFESNSVIDIINDLLYRNGACVDVYFDTYGCMVIEPYNRDDWLGAGIYLTTPEIAKHVLKMDVTNIITGVGVNGADSKSDARNYSSKDYLGIDLTAMFGLTNSIIGNPNKSTSSTSNNSSTTTNDLGISTSTPIMVNCDNIHNRTRDRQMLNDCANALRSKGYSVTVGGIGPNNHVSDLRKMPANSCLFTIVGGLCAGTFIDMGDKYYQNYMKNGNKKVVLGCLSPPITRQLDTLTWLEKAHDDDFSGSGFTGLANPGKYLKEHGINYVYGSNGTELGNNFSTGSSGNVSTSTSNTTDTTVTVDTNSAEYIEAEKKAAIKEMTDSVRDLLSFKVNFPGGNPVFKELHTNSFLWTELPETVNLVNFEKITSAMTGEYSRYTGYVLNRWYIEGVTTTMDSNGLNFEVELNPFASPYSSYMQAYEQAVNAYSNSENQNSGSSSSTNSSSGNYITDASISALAKKIIGNATDDRTKAKLLFDWVDVNIAYPSNSYSNTVKGALGTLKARVGNCCDTTQLYIAMARSVGLTCRFAHGPNHVWAEVKLVGSWFTVDPVSHSRGWGGTYNGCTAYSHYDVLPF